MAAPCASSRRSSSLCRRPSMRRRSRPARQRVAEQLQQQLQVHVPGAARQRIGEPEDAGGHTAHAEGNHEHRADLQLRQALALDQLIPARRGAVADLREAQVFEAALEPGIGFDGGAAPGFHAALRERAVRGVHLVDRRAVGREQPHEGGIDAGGIAQGVEAVADAGFDGAAPHVLQVDGYFGAGDIDAQGGFAAARRPHARREHVRRGQITRMIRCLSHSFASYSVDPCAAPTRATDSNTCLLPKLRSILSQVFRNTS